MSKKPAPKGGSPLYWSAETWAFIALRLLLSLLFISAGIGKFIGPEGFAFANYYHGFVPYIINTFSEETVIPRLLLFPFAYTIGYLEFVLGLLLIAGVKTKYTLALIALTLVALAFGQMLLRTPESAQTLSQITLFLLVTCAALYFVRHNKLEAMR